MVKKNDDVVARLVIHGLPTMKAAQFKRLRLWLLRAAKELYIEDRKVFAKRYRATLRKAAR
jgi:hypothetical protein